MKYNERERHMPPAITGVSRWCDVCKTVQPMEGAKMIPGKTKLHGRWCCAKCLENGVTVK